LVIVYIIDTCTLKIYTLSLHDALPILDGMNIISNDGSNKLNRSRKARVSYKVQRTINASLNAATSTRAVSSNPNFVGYPRFPAPVEDRKSGSAGMPRPISYAVFCLKKKKQ